MTKSCVLCHQEFVPLTVRTRLCIGCDTEHGSEVLRARTIRKRILNSFGNRCNHCGSTDPTAIQIDHVYGGGNLQRKKKTSTACYYKSIERSVMLGEGKYQLLCSACNWQKRIDNKEDGVVYA